MSLKTAAAVGFALLVGLSIWAGAHISIFEEMMNAPQLFWGTQALVDLYVGFVMISVLYFRFEPSKTRAFAWMLATFVFGNIASCVYIFLHHDRIAAMFRKPSA